MVRKSLGARDVALQQSLCLVCTRPWVSKTIKQKGKKGMRKRGGDEEREGREGKTGKGKNEKEMRFPRAWIPK